MLTSGNLEIGITGQSYTITADVWSLGLTILEGAKQRFPFLDTQTRLDLDLLTHIVHQPVPRLEDEPETGIKWSEGFKHFIEHWYANVL
jgi:mitogen-activated protein kinase kinase